MFKGIFKPSTVTQVDLSKHVSTDQVNTVLLSSLILIRA